MTYKLKENVGIVYWMETKEYLIEDENGKEFTIRVTESSKGSQTIIETENDWNYITPLDFYNNYYPLITYLNSSNTKIDNVILDKSQLANSSEIQKLFVEPIQIFPNPVKNQFTLVYNYPEIGFVKFTLTDEKGKIISEEKLHKKEPVLEYNHDVSGYKKGIYNIMISSESREDHNILIVQ